MHKGCDGFLYPSTRDFGNTVCERPEDVSRSHQALHRRDAETSQRPDLQSIDKRKGHFFDSKDRNSSRTGLNMPRTLYQHQRHTSQWGGAAIGNRKSPTYTSPDLQCKNDVGDTSRTRDPTAHREVAERTQLYQV
jgi:hypothetical protein